MSLSIRPYACWHNGNHPFFFNLYFGITTACSSVGIWCSFQITIFNVNVGLEESQWSLWPWHSNPSQPSSQSFHLLGQCLFSSTLLLDLDESPATYLLLFLVNMNNLCSKQSLIFIALHCDLSYYNWLHINSILCYFAGTEVLSGRVRVLFSSFGVCVSFSIGYMLLPLFAYFLRDWKHLLVAISLPGLIDLPLWW